MLIDLCIAQSDNQVSSAGIMHPYMSEKDKEKELERRKLKRIRKKRIKDKMWGVESEKAK